MKRENQAMISPVKYVTEALPFPPPQGQEETPVAAPPVCIRRLRPVPIQAPYCQVLPQGQG